jgi:prepilin-type processing-associated H-X9-DG protein
VVIAVIALLLGILMPTLQRVRSHAKAVGCRSNLRQLGLYLHAYAAANDGKLIVAGTGPRPKPNPSRPQAERSLLRLLRPYWQDCNDVVFCPATKRYPDRYWKPVWRTDAAWCVPLKWFTGYSFNDKSLPPYIYGSYGAHGFLGNIHFAGNKHAPGRPWYTVDTNAAASIPAFMDCLRIRFAAPGSPPGREAVRDEGPRPASADFCINRHNGGINSAFLDGSVRKVGLKELWTLKWHRDYNTAGPWTRAGGVQPEDWPEWMRKFKDY